MTGESLSRRRSGRGGGPGDGHARPADRPGRPPEWIWPPRWHGTLAVAHRPYLSRGAWTLANKFPQAAVAVPRARRWRRERLTSREVVRELARG